MQRISITLMAAFFLLLTGCASINKYNLTKDIEVDAASDPKANLSGYKTYAWLGAGEILNDPEKRWKQTDLPIAGDIKYLIDRELRERGINLAEPASADLAVAFFIGIDMEAQKLKKNPDTKVEMLQNIPEAGLIVALIDTKSGFVVWVGEAVGELNKDATDEEVRERLDYAVTEMIKLYPKK